MQKTLCNSCFHYEACCAIDLSGCLGNPECENWECDHYLDSERVKIQGKANRLERINIYSNGDTCVSYHCSCCKELHGIKIFKEKEWDAYYREHYREAVELPKFCKVCGSVMGEIVEM
jgi:hypothetical protein